jgi:hypothetical protein
VVLARNDDQPVVQGGKRRSGRQGWNFLGGGGPAPGKEAFAGVAEGGTPPGREQIDSILWTVSHWPKR